MIRITLMRGSWTAWNGRVVAAQTIVREFEDEYRAADWFVNDSYFSEPYTISATWERHEAAPVIPRCFKCDGTDGDIVDRNRRSSLGKPDWMHAYGACPPSPQKVCMIPDCGCIGEAHP